MSESEQSLKGTSQIKILSAEDIEGMTVVCKLAREVLDIAALMVKPGMTTEEIDHTVHLACTARNCYPSPLNYYNFPKSCCTSVNERVCISANVRHLFPSSFAVDITVYHNGFHGDLNETFFVGEADEGAKKLVQTTFECLMQAIDSENKAVGVMKPGHVFTIEPMICEGGWQDETWPDGWTAVTRDGKRSAQFEHTLLVTETGCDILTRRLDDNGRPHFLNQI
ncbi:unnamed protein product [Coregonus sp. 'balchen']|nr:unnamed protein product [Coregonus sp. 'balchen']